MCPSSIIGRGALVGVFILFSTVGHAQFRAKRFDIQPNQAVQLECAPVKITPRDRDRDPVYKIDVDLEFDNNSNIDSLNVVHTTMDGNVYIRSDQYNQTGLSQPIPYRTKWIWRGVWKKHSNFVMLGDVTRSAAGTWTYTETLLRNGAVNMVMESRCHVEGD
jgi:hypothetical protein